MNNNIILSSLIFSVIILLFFIINIYSCPIVGNQSVTTYAIIGDTLVGSYTPIGTILSPPGGGTGIEEYFLSPSGKVHNGNSCVSDEVGVWSYHVKLYGLPPGEDDPKKAGWGAEGIATGYVDHAIYDVKAEPSNIEEKNIGKEEYRAKISFKLQGYEPVEGNYPIISWRAYIDGKEWKSGGILDKGEYKDFLEWDGMIEGKKAEKGDHIIKIEVVRNGKEDSDSCIVTIGKKLISIGVSPDEIPSDGGSSTAVVSVTVVNSGGRPVNNADVTIEITEGDGIFKDKEGNKVTSISLKTNNMGVASTKYYSGDNGMGVNFRGSYIKSEKEKYIAEGSLVQYNVEFISKLMYYGKQKSWSIGYKITPKFTAGSGSIKIFEGEVEKGSITLTDLNEGEHTVAVSEDILNMLEADKVYNVKVRVNKLDKNGNIVSYDEDSGSVKVFKPEIKMERADFWIETKTMYYHYLEVSKIKASVVYPVSIAERVGEIYKEWEGEINFAEEGTDIYSQNTNLGAVLPNKANVRKGIGKDGYVEIEAKSLVGATGGIRPIAKIKATANNCVQGFNNPLDVRQWVDENKDGGTDWLQVMGTHILNFYKNKIGECSYITSYTTGIGKDVISDVQGETVLGETVIHLNPYFKGFRLNNGPISVNQTVIHECRHVWQGLILKQTGSEYVGNSNNSDDDKYPEKFPTGTQYTNYAERIIDKYENILHGDDQITRTDTLKRVTDQVYILDDKTKCPVMQLTDTVFVDGEEWKRVSNLAGQGTNKVYLIASYGDNTKGILPTVNFGDGSTTGEKPSGTSTVTMRYQHLTKDDATNSPWYGTYNNPLETDAYSFETRNK